MKLSEELIKIAVTIRRTNWLSVPQFLSLWDSPLPMNTVSKKQLKNAPLYAGKVKHGFQRRYFHDRVEEKLKKFPHAKVTYIDLAKYQPWGNQKGDYRAQVYITGLSKKELLEAVKKCSDPSLPLFDQNWAPIPLLDLKLPKKLDHVDDQIYYDHVEEPLTQKARIRAVKNLTVCKPEEVILGIY